jgi:molybdate/tungstate transport system ATP-binding protein
MIEIKKLAVTYDEFALKDVSFKIPTGSYAVLMGKTGCGKTTILEAVCGLRKIDSGQILLSGREVTDLSPADRGIGFVPQDLALFPTMTIFDHLAFSLVVRKWEQKKIAERVGELADWLSIEHLLKRKPKGLSGGEQQRVALGRALAFNPKILCLDEPLSALDDETREEMYQVFKTVRERNPVTVMHITHNLSETKNLADHVFFFDQGTVTEKNP